MVETTLKHRANLKVQHPARPSNISDGLSGWMDGIDTFVPGPHWHDYEREIRGTISDYDFNLRGVAGYRSPDFSLMKAMMWAENDPGDPSWNRRPMQIGNSGDPGLRDLLKPFGAGTVVIPPQWQGRLSSGAISNAQDNIRAAIGYVLSKASQSDLRTVVERGAPIFEIEAAKGDTLDAIARHYGSTTDHLRRLNGSSALRPHQKVKVQKAKTARVIFGWRPIDKNSLQSNYNGNPDVDYAAKLQYILDYIKIYP